MALLGVVLLSGLSVGQVTTTTTTTVYIGGSLAKTCYPVAYDPPVLNDGFTVARATVQFTFDSATDTLTLLVTNTSPEFPGQASPVLKEIYFNLPALAVSNAWIEAQHAPTGLQPNFELAIDTNLSDGLNTLHGGCFGRFGMRLRDPGPLAGSIAPIADSLPGPSNTFVHGAVTFQLHIVPASMGASALRASTFANSISYPESEGEQARVVCYFNSGENNRNGYVTNQPLGNGGGATGWVVGTPAAGETITIAAGGTPGWHGVVAVSLDPGPTPFFGHLFPIGEIYYIVLQDTIPSAGWTSVNIQIPQNPNPQEVTMIPVFGVTVLINPTPNPGPGSRGISVSEQFSLEVDF